MLNETASLYRHAPVQPGPEFVLSKAVVRAADQLGLKGVELAEILGISTAQVSRLKAGAWTLDGKSFELAGHVVRLYRSLAAMTGGEDAATRSWMRAPHRVFQTTPAQHIKTVHGLISCVAYIDSHRAPL